MKRATILRYLLLPTIVGLIATWAVYRYVAPQEAAAQVKTVQVVVAAQPVRARTVLTSASVKMKPFPKGYLPSGALTSIKDAVGRIATAPLAAGEIVLDSHLANAESKVSLAYHVPKGMRAVTVPVNETTGVAGFVQPGDHVDLVAVFGGKNSGGGSSASPGTANSEPHAEMLFQNVLVLAVGQAQQGTQDASKGNLNGYTSFTLALTPNDAVKLSLASGESAFRFTLRPAVSEPNVAGRVITNADLNP